MTAANKQSVTKYRITFVYGSWHLWADIDRPKINNTDIRGFADLAQLAVNVALDTMPSVERKHVAHDYAIFELAQQISGESKATLVYGFDTLANE